MALCCVRTKDKEKIFLFLKRSRLLHPQYPIVHLKKKEEDAVRSLLDSFPSLIEWDFAIPIVRFLCPSEEEQILSLLAPDHTHSLSSSSSSDSSTSSVACPQSKEILFQVHVPSLVLFSLHSKRISDSLKSVTLKFLSESFRLLMSSDVGRWVEGVVAHLMHKYEKLGDVILFQESPTLLHLLSSSPPNNWRDHEEFQTFWSFYSLDIYSPSRIPSSSSSSSPDSSVSSCSLFSSFDNYTSCPSELESYWKSEGWDWLRVIAVALSKASSSSIRTVGFQVGRRDMIGTW